MRPFLLPFFVIVGVAAPITVDTRSLLVSVDAATSRWSAEVKGTPMRLNNAHFLPGDDPSGWCRLFKFLLVVHPHPQTFHRWKNTIEIVEESEVVYKNLSATLAVGCQDFSESLAGGWVIFGEDLLGPVRSEYFAPGSER